jgi:NAD-dependent DNA ligase
MTLTGHGAVIGSSITQATDYLVVGDKPGAKLTKAKHGRHRAQRERVLWPCERR